MQGLVLCLLKEFVNCIQIPVWVEITVMIVSQKFAVKIRKIFLLLANDFIKSHFQL